MSVDIDEIEADFDYTESPPLCDDFIFDYVIETKREPVEYNHFVADEMRKRKGNGEDVSEKMQDIGKKWKEAKRLRIEDQTE